MQFEWAVGMCVFCDVIVVDVFAGFIITCVARQLHIDPFVVLFLHHGCADAGLAPNSSVSDRPRGAVQSAP